MTYRIGRLYSSQVHRRPGTDLTISEASRIGAEFAFPDRREGRIRCTTKGSTQKEIEECKYDAKASHLMQRRMTGIKGQRTRKAGGRQMRLHEYELRAQSKDVETGEINKPLRFASARKHLRRVH